MKKTMKKRAPLTRWDIQQHLKTDADRIAYLDAALEDAPDDAEFIAKVLGDIARSKGMASVAKTTGLSRENLYRALSGEHEPNLRTFLKVLQAVGVQLHATRAH